MTTPAQWAELVTTALLGTDRRPLDAADPPGQVLHAGRPAPHPGPVGRPSRSSRRRTAAEPPAAAPTQDGQPAPEPADRLLDQLLRTPDPALISCWLGVCADRGYVVSALHWTTLARLAARSTGYDRTALGASPRPSGSLVPPAEPRVATARRGRRAVGRRRPRGGRPAASRSRLTAEDVLAEPERLLDHPQPWGPDLVSAAYAVLGGEGQVPPARPSPPDWAWRCRPSSIRASPGRGSTTCSPPTPPRLGAGRSGTASWPWSSRRTLAPPSSTRLHRRQRSDRLHQGGDPPCLTSPSPRPPRWPRPIGSDRTPRRRTPTSSPPWPPSTTAPPAALAALALGRGDLPDGRHAERRHRDHRRSTSARAG